MDKYIKNTRRFDYNNKYIYSTRYTVQNNLLHNNISECYITVIRDESYDNHIYVRVTISDKPHETFYNSLNEAFNYVNQFIKTSPTC